MSGTIPAHIFVEIERRVCAEQRGKETTCLVHVASPPGMAVKVGREVVVLETAHPAYDRIDLVAIAEEVSGTGAQAIAGVAAPNPVAPPLPEGWLPVALVYVPRSASVIHQEWIL